MPVEITGHTVDLHRPGPELALLLLGSYRRLVDAAIVEQAARGYGAVRPSHDYAMRAIDSGASNASELGRHLAVTKQSALRTISVLVDRGWVARQDDPQDARRMAVHITDLGREVLTAGEEVLNDLRRQWEQELGKEALATLEAQLARLVGDRPVRLAAPGWFAHDDS